LGPERREVAAEIPYLSIIVPTLNEAGGIAAALGRLLPFRRESEVIVVDGGSDDGTAEVARPLADRVLTSARGRAKQMNAGAAAATGDVLLFLHADTALPDDALRLIALGLASTGRAWGRFDVTIAGTDPMLAAVSTAMNLRSRWSGIATGDQAIFVRREAFEAIGGFAEIPLMEDVEISQRLRTLSRPLCVRSRAITSGRRWERDGVTRTIVLMWRIRFAYAMGVSPERLARRYGVERTSS
jgi:rSAM/selenodomain-associated transferase 2